MMKTLLLSPPLNLETRMGALSEGGAVMPALGLLYIAGWMREKGHDINILDAEGMGLGLTETVEAIRQQSPEVLGITATTLSVHVAAAVADAAKKVIPSLKVYLGGPHVTAMPHDTMDNFPTIDGCILGDGEISFEKVISNIAAGRSPGNDVDGVIWREDGKTHHTPKTSHLSNLDILPMPAFDLLQGFPHRYRPPFHSYHQLPVANIVTARGCPGVCSFCDRAVFGREPFFHSIEYILDMVEHLVTTYGVKEISIKDDMFIFDKDRVFKFCEALQERNLNISWSCNARVNYISDEMLAVMKKAGCWMISYGIESGAPTMLKKMMKGITLRQINKALELTRKHGIVSKGFFMIGIPGETHDTMEQTLAYLDGLQLDEMNVNFFTPFPGSALYEETLSEGFVPEFDRMNMLDIVYVPKGLTAQELKQFQKKMIRAFYLRPSKVLCYGLRALTNFNETKRLWRMAKMFVSLVLNRAI